MPDAPPPYTLTDTWRLNNRVNLLLLDHLTEEQLAFAPNPKARSIADQFAHLHNVRILWLEPRVPAVAKALTKIDKGTATKALLHESLEESAKAIGDLISEAERSGKLKSYKRGVIAFFGYALAHEAHHRGQIVLHLKQAKMRIDPMVGYSLWEWEKI
jgi:uncharacterized damage-inducible protein DinB